LGTVALSNKARRWPVTAFVLGAGIRAQSEAIKALEAKLEKHGLEHYNKLRKTADKKEGKISLKTPCSERIQTDCCLRRFAQ
jgi:hypothetical protein